MLQLPPLYPITDPGREASLSEQVRRLGAAGFPLVQFRGKPLDPAVQWTELRAALAAAAARGGWPAICVDDRADLAVLAAQAGLRPWGLHLGQADLAPDLAARLPGLAGLHLGTSTHRAEEWDHPDPACDHAGVGPVRPTATKATGTAPLGLEGLRAGCAALRQRGLAPVAIGGLTGADARACYAAGAESLAMVSGLAGAEAPADLLWRAQAERWRVRPPFAPGQGIALIGGSGGGKSTLATCLAERLGLPARDSDQRIQADSGLDIPEIFRTRGEAGFRDLEALAVRACLGSPAVLALGAGAWERADTRAAIHAAGFAPLWLAEVPERAWARVARDPGRPLAAAGEAFLARWAERAPAWSLAPMALPLGRPAAELARELATAAGS